MAKARSLKSENQTFRTPLKLAIRDFKDKSKKMPFTIDNNRGIKMFGNQTKYPKSGVNSAKNPLIFSPFFSIFCISICVRLDYTFINIIQLQNIGLDAFTNFFSLPFSKPFSNFQFVFAFVPGSQTIPGSKLTRRFQLTQGRSDSSLRPLLLSSDFKRLGGN